MTWIRKWGHSELLLSVVSLRSAGKKTDQLTDHQRLKNLFTTQQLQCIYWKCAYEFHLYCKWWEGTEKKGQWKLMWEHDVDIGFKMKPNFVWLCRPSYNKENPELRDSSGSHGDAAMWRHGCAHARIRMVQRRKKVKLCTPSHTPHQCHHYVHRAASMIHDHI